MSFVIAVMLIVVCDPNLLRCSEVRAWETAWRNVAACREDKAAITNRIAATSQGVVMTRCKLYLDEDRRFAGRVIMRDGVTELLF